MKFYRVCKPETKQGLWYNQQGEFTGLIHNEFKFCLNCKLEMPFDKEIVGWLSAVKDLEDLWVWFTKTDVTRLQEEGYYIHEYEVTEHKWYDKSQHWIINQKTSNITKQIKI